MAPSLKVLACGFLTDKEVVPLSQCRGFFHVALELSPLRPEAWLGVQTLGHVSARAGPWVALWSRSHVAETSSATAAPSRLVLIPAPLWVPLPPRDGPSSRCSYPPPPPRHRLADTRPPVGLSLLLVSPRRSVLLNAFSEAAEAGPLFTGLFATCVSSLRKRLRLLSILVGCCCLLLRALLQACLLVSPVV